MSASASLQSQIKFMPAPFDSAAGVRAAESLNSTALNNEARQLVSGVAGCSPYLARLMAKVGDGLTDLLLAPCKTSIAGAIEMAWRAADSEDPSLQMKELRAAKDLAALSTALAEISGARTTMEAAADYSRFADAATGSALRMALRRLMRKGFRPVSEERPEEDCGLVVLAMGKMGAFELNYSSDIDLIVLFDATADALGAPEDARTLAISAAKQLVSRLNEQTADGYVFRTDLRLRPDPGVSAAAVSISAAETYYESYGQNWERAAFIKARPVAGDIALGENFIGSLRPFIWRKYLDYASIEDIQSVMRQIHDVEEFRRSFRGHDLKRGRGGIRQIEFFVQSQQLIVGGKDPACRGRGTLAMLDALSARGDVATKTRDILSENYRYLRRVEHRIQMIADEQTHRVPVQESDLRRLAMFLGEKDVSAFEKRLKSVLASTDVEASMPLVDGAADASVGTLRFSGVELDFDTEATLSRLGFRRPQIVDATFRRWHAGETRATRSPRARALLTKLTPQLLAALARANDPDGAFTAFDAFIRQLPAGVQIFSLLLNRPDVFDRLLEIMTMSPFLGRDLARRAYLVEALIEAQWPEEMASSSALQQSLHTNLVDGEVDFESSLNVVRRWASERNFIIAAQLVTSMIAADGAAARFTAVAEAVISEILPIAQREMENRFGAFPGELVVVALGRLGSGRMTAASDVDLMFIYEGAPDAVSEPGGLDATTYYARLVRRFLTAMCSPTEEGALYDVDMQLRPSGGKGPAAVSFTAFQLYYRNDAWTWEKMALTKARVVAGPSLLRRRVEDEIREILGQCRNEREIARDVDDMRQRLVASKPAKSVWDIKNAVGGATEIDFVIQHLILTHAHQLPKALPLDPVAAIKWLAEYGALDADGSEKLMRAFNVFECVTQLSRASLGGVFEPASAGVSLQCAMSRVLAAANLDQAETELADVMRTTREIYESVIVRCSDAGGPS